MSARALERFVRDFVTPLLAGGRVVVDAPLSLHKLVPELANRGGRAQSISRLFDRELLLARERRAKLLLADPDLPEPDLEELSLWMGLHNLLVFDHPDRARVWARASAWATVESVARGQMSLSQPDLGSALARHLAVGACLELVRRDVVIKLIEGEIRRIGQPPTNVFITGRRLGFAWAPPSGVRDEIVRWVEQTHAHETNRLLSDALWASPLTCLLEPIHAPPGWSPLWGARFLRHASFARAVCHAWAKERDWVGTGGAIMGALLTTFSRLETAHEPDLASRRPALPGVVDEAGPDEVGAVVGALIHLHFLKVIEADSRLGLAMGSRDRGALTFLALPLVLDELESVLGSPIARGPQTARHQGPGQPWERLHTHVECRWLEHLERLREFVPRDAVENLLATVVPRIVKEP